MEEKVFQDWLDSIDSKEKCSFRYLPKDITVGQARRLYSKYLDLIDDNDFLIKEAKKRMEQVKYYPENWNFLEATWVEEMLCNQDKR